MSENTYEGYIEIHNFTKEQVEWAAVDNGVITVSCREVLAKPLPNGDRCRKAKYNHVIPANVNIGFLTIIWLDNNTLQVYAPLYNSRQGLAIL